MENKFFIKMIALMIVNAVAPVYCMDNNFDDIIHVEVAVGKKGTFEDVRGGLDLFGRIELARMKTLGMGDADVTQGFFAIQKAEYMDEEHGLKGWLTKDGHRDGSFVPSIVRQHIINKLPQGTFTTSSMQDYIFPDFLPESIIKNLEEGPVLCRTDYGSVALILAEGFPRRDDTFSYATYENGNKNKIIVENDPKIKEKMKKLQQRRERSGKIFPAKPFNLKSLNYSVPTWKE